MRELSRTMHLITSPLWAYQFLLFKSCLASVPAVLLCVVDQAFEAIPQQEPLSVILRFGDERQENIAQVGADFVNAQDFKRLGEVEHFGNRWRFFQGIAAKGVREARKLAM